MKGLEGIRKCGTVRKKGQEYRTEREGMSWGDRRNDEWEGRIISAVGALGVKVDVIPGRMNEIVLFSILEGSYYGQCSELCGVLHGFMPITVMFF